MRYFNTYGPVNVQEHFVVPRDALMTDMIAQIEQVSYVTVYAPRQMGKTTLLRRITSILEETPGYIPISLSCEAFEGVEEGDHRRRTGQGQYLNMSQFEALATLMQPAILDYSANQRVATHQGNRHSVYAPHNAYPCQGDERYCVIAVKNEAEWQRLRQAIGSPAWTDQPEFFSHAGPKLFRTGQPYDLRRSSDQRSSDAPERHTWRLCRRWTMHRRTQCLCLRRPPRHE